MSETQYFYDVASAICAIENTHMKYIESIIKDDFSQRFKDVPSYYLRIGAIPVHLFMKYKSGCLITINNYREEFALAIGSARFEEEVKKHPEEFEKSFDIMQDYFDDAEREYYSGFIGKLLSFFRKPKAYKKIE